MAQDTAAAERSAHVERGNAPLRIQTVDPFVGPAFGPIRLRAVDERDAEIERLRAENERLRARVADLEADAREERRDARLAAKEERWR